MKNMEQVYARFAEMVDEMQERGEKLSFRRICRKLGVAPASLDEILWEELGMSGNELLESLENHIS